MRSIIVLVFGIFLSLSVVGQSRFSFGLSTQVGLSGKNTHQERENFFRGTVPTRSYSEEGNKFVAVAGAGVWAAYDLTNSIAVQAGLQYVNSGNTDYRQSYSETIATGQRSFATALSYRFRAHQLQLPLEIKLGLPLNKIQPQLILGAQLSRDWIGTIYAENPYYRDEPDREYVVAWSEDYRADFSAERLSVQPFVGFGLRLNDVMNISLRHTWIPETQAITWEENYIPPSPSENPMIIICGVLNRYRTQSTHQQSTTIKLEYRLF